MTRGMMSIHILLLDDEPAIRRLVARVLEDAGYEVDTLAEPLAAIEAIAEGGYGLIITNSVMQGPGGARLVAAMRRQYPTLPMLHLDDQSHPRAPEFPADVPTLAKPFERNVLLEAVRGLVGG